MGSLQQNVIPPPFRQPPLHSGVKVDERPQTAPQLHEPLRRHRADKPTSVIRNDAGASSNHIADPPNQMAAGDAGLEPTESMNVEPNTAQQSARQPWTIAHPTLPVVVVASFISLVFVAPFVPSGFFLFTPVLPFVAHHWAVELRWRRELRRVMRPESDQ